MIIKEKERKEIDNKYKWDLTCIYKDEKSFENDLKKVKDLLDKIVSMKGNLTKNSDSLYNYLILDDELNRVLTRLYVYASCKSDENVLDSKSENRFNKVLNLYSKVSDKESFILPELLKTDYDVIKKYIKENDKLKEYEFDLMLVYRYQPHVVTEQEESLLSNIGTLQEDFEKSFDTLTNGIMRYGYIKDEDGNKVELTNGNYSKYIKSNSRKVRKNAFNTRFKTVNLYKQALAVSYIGHLKADSYIAKRKKYNSTLEMYLFPDFMKESDYNNLLEFASNNIDTLHRVFKLRKDVLKLDKLYDYDLACNLVDYDKKYSFEEAKDIILEALKVMGEEYHSILSKAFKENWIDVYPNKGKKSGFYSTFAGLGNPIILANYNDNFDGISSLAHELGHSVHTYYSHKNNKPHLEDYSIFVAEVASLTNEILLANYIINNSKDKKLKLLAISNMIDVISDNFFGTIANGSIFEKEAHHLADEGLDIDTETLSGIKKDIMKNYYGNIVNVSKNTNSLDGWCMIPHFYSSFYYYKYAIGVTGACYVAEKILSKDKEYRDKYINFLKMGGSKTPIDELKSIDIDFSNDKILLSCINYLNSLIDKFYEIKNS